MVFLRWPKKNARLRLRYSATELHKQVLRGLMANPFFSFEERIFFHKRFQRYSFKFSISFFRNSCLFTGHGRSVFRIFKLSRHSAKANASAGAIMGLRKSSF